MRAKTFETLRSFVFSTVPFNDCACGGVIDSNETLFVLVDNFLVILMINQLFPGDSSLGLLLSNILLKRNFLRQIISVVWIID